MAVLEWIARGLENGFRMAWEVGWALVLGFMLSAIVQAWIPRARMQRALGTADLRSVALATGLGAASSSCSYAAVAIARSMFAKGASLTAAMVFQFASTNLVFEIGIVLWIFLGWQFTLAEFVGGIVLIALMWAGLRIVVTRRLEEDSRAHAEQAEARHQHPMAGSEGTGWRTRLTSLAAWSDVAHNFRGDWRMLWKEIGGGFLIAGFVALLPARFFNALFLTDAPTGLRLVENVLVGPLVAVLSFVCSVGNIPLAAVLWAGGSSFSGVIAFIYADLIVIPIVLIYGKFYGWRLTRRLVGIMFVTMAGAALLVDGIFNLLDLVPDERPEIESITERPIEWNYTAVLNIVAAVVAGALIWPTVRRGARDPVCGMAVDRLKATFASEYGDRRYVFCGPRCKQTFDAAPERYT